MSFIYTFVSSNYLLLYYPNTLIPYSGPPLTSHQWFGGKDDIKLISVNWLSTICKLRGYQWNFDILDSCTKLHAVCRGIKVDDGYGYGMLILLFYMIMYGQKR